MMLAGKYEAFEGVPGAPGTVQRARHTVSGQSVLVHQLVPDSPDAIETLKLALRYALRRPGSSTLLDVFDGPECTYIVTANRPECISLHEWLRRKLSSHRAKHSRQSLKSVTSEPVDRKHTSAPDQSVMPSIGQFSEARAVDDGRSASMPGNNQVVPGTRAGEFTRMFLDQKSTPTPASPSLFDGQVQRPAHAPPNPQARTPVPADSGEFTKLFRPAAAAQPKPPVELPNSSVQNDGSGFPARGSGEFTRLFGGREAGSAPLDRAQHGPGEFTRLFAGANARDVQNFSAESDSAARENLLPDVLSPLHSPSVPGGSTGPSEFTRVVRSGTDREASTAEPVPGEARPNTVSEPAAAAPVQLPKVPEIKAPEVKLPELKVPAPPAPPAANLPLTAGVMPALLIVGAVLILALALILFFALRR